LAEASLSSPSSGLASYLGSSSSSELTFFSYCFFFFLDALSSSSVKGTATSALVGDTGTD